jgi:hypothetical protein
MHHMESNANTSKETICLEGDLSQLESRQGSQTSSYQNFYET